MTKVFSLYKRPIFTAFLLCLYYIFPHSVSIGFELLYLIVLCLSNKRGSKVVLLPFVWYLLFAIVLCLLNVFRIDYNNPTNLNYLRTLFNGLLFVLIACYSIKNKKDIDVFLKSFAISGVVICLMLIPSTILLISMGGGRLGQNVEIESNEFLNNAINLGYVLMLINICQFYGAIKAKSIKSKLLFTILFIFSFVLLLLCGTRKSLLGCMLCYGLFVFYHNKNQFRRLLKYSIIAIIAVIALYHLLMNVEVFYNAVGNRMEGLFSFINPNYDVQVDESTEVREELINKSKQIFFRHPIVGVGIQESQKLLAPVSHPHNNFYTCLIFGGLLVFLSYYWYHIRIMLMYLRIKKRDVIDIALMCLLIALLFQDYSATTYNIIYFPTFLSVLYLNLAYKRMYPSTVI